MLGKVGLLKKDEVLALTEGLNEVAELHRKGKFHLEQESEDCHTAIENFLVKKLGHLGKKIHMGRSRNDQVLTAIRLYGKDQIKIIEKKLKILAETILKFAKKHEFVPMPGYTHSQRAMPSSVGQWAGSFVESLLDDLKSLHLAYDLNDQNPLGSAAGFGTSLPIDRQYTTQLLGFSRTQINCLYCQNSRGKIEGATVAALSQIMLTLGKIASDLLLFTMQEFDFFKVSSMLKTGSSIMPQKQNLDIMEVLRANVSVVQSYQFQIFSVSQNLMSGYNKDLKVTKQPLIESFKITLNSLEITNLLFKHLTPNKTKLLAAFERDIFATDIANELVKKGMPFRDAYKKVGDELRVADTSSSATPLQNIKSKKHLGATGKLGL
jgi:argininosuccinate lyase